MNYQETHSENSSNKYAYGADEVNNCACPATTAGLDTHRPALSKLAGRFDERLRDSYKGMEEGTVSDKVAETEWRAAVEEARQKGKTTEVEIGELVIERLWGDA